VLDELRELSRGLHPAVLAEGGLGPALRALARRSPIAVELNVAVDKRLPQQVEITTYYVVSELLTNAVKHAQASAILVSLAAAEEMLLLSVRDDGIGRRSRTRFRAHRRAGPCRGDRRNGPSAQPPRRRHQHRH
jgi:signal transduction histidine kinase